MTVFVVGNCAVDVVLRVPRLPRPGETILADGRIVDLGGKGANQAVIVARSGVPTVFGAAVGEDAEAAFARQLLAREPLTELRLVSTAAPTDQSIITVMPGGENAIISTALAARSLGPSEADILLDGLGRGDTLLLQGNLSAEATLHCLSRARRAGARTVLNPAPIHFDYEPLWPLTDFAILNEIELRDLAGGEDEAARRLSDRGVGTVIVTRGAAGAIAFPAGETLAIPAPRVEAIDTAGAGDVFCGVLVGAQALGRSLPAAMELAVAAAALSVTRRGTQSSFPSVPELATLFAANSGASHERA